jgi:hypothetical protein
MVLSRFIVLLKLEVLPVLILLYCCIYMVLLLFSTGGPWRLPRTRPVSLRPMMLKEEYKKFADSVNWKLSWNSLSIEMIVFGLVSFLIPPFAAYIMVRLNILL